MWYAIIGEDAEGSLSKRKQLRPAHIERLASLHQQGRVLVAGPHPVDDTDEPTNAGFTGSLMVVDFPTVVEAQEWADQDPYVLGGVFSSVIVKPFIQVLP